MVVEYRLMRAEEEHAVLALWCEVFDLPDMAYAAARFATDPAGHSHTFVAVAPGGTIMSTLHYRMAYRRDAAGMPRPVGEIDSVATRTDARRQGHATRLLLLVLKTLDTIGCDWSVLVASGEDSRRLYERHGWRCYPEPWRRGMVTGVLPEPGGRYVARQYDPLQERDGWDQVADVDAAFNRMRPLTVVRDAAYWRSFAALRVGTWITTEGLVIFAAFREASDPRLCGYAMAEYYPPAFQVRDMAVLPGEPGAALAVLTAVAAEAQQRGIPLSGRMYLPREPAIDAALDRLFGSTLHSGEAHGQWMARTIAADFTDQQLDAIFAAPSAHMSAIDLF